MAYKWQNPAVANVTVDVNVKADGTIATGSEASAGTKAFTLAGIGANATYPQAQQVLDAFIGGIASGTYVESSAVRTIKSGVEEE